MVSRKRSKRAARRFMEGVGSAGINSLEHYSTRESENSGALAIPSILWSLGYPSGFDVLVYWAFFFLEF
jgi:hypothetical protein